MKRWAEETGYFDGASGSIDDLQVELHVHEGVSDADGCEEETDRN